MLVQAFPQTLLLSPRSSLGRRFRRRASGAARAELEIVLPRSPEAQLEACFLAVRRGEELGLRKQRCHLALPPIYRSDLDDWPGGDAQRLLVLTPLVERLLLRLGGTGLSSGVLDAADEQHVRFFRTSSHLAIVLGSADSLAAVRRMASANEELTLLLINCEWAQADFGLLPFLRSASSRADERFAAELTETFSLRDSRIRGQDLQILRAFPAGWRVYATTAAGSATAMINELPTSPETGALEKLVTSLGDASIANADVMKRLKAEFDFNKDSLKR